MSADPQRSNPQRSGLYLRVVLLAGFGGLLVLLLAAGIEAMSILDTAHQEEQSALREFLSRNAVLLHLDSNLQGYGRFVQQTVSARQQEQEEAAAELQRLSSEIHAVLLTYPLERQPEEKALLEAFALELADQEKMLNRAIADKRDRTAELTIWEEVFPGHLKMVAATAQLSAWNQSQLRGTDGTLLAEFSRLRTNLKQLLTVLLGSGLILAMGSIVYIAGQEREIRQRYAELAESRDSQADLSSRLLNAQEQERRSLSRELHDEVGQSLGALLVDVGRLSAMLPAEDRRLQEAAEQIKALAERSVSSVRNISLLLRPSMLDDLGLVAALEWQAREISRNSEVEVEVESDGIPGDLDEEHKICIYRLTQEALNNVARHSGARHAWVNVRSESGKIEVSIRDDGRGFDPKRAKGLGLLGMEERVRRLGGLVHIQSKPSEGTTLKAELPLA
jgi:signal transduction histidine kinase